ncbi:hypothetical protein LEN26_001211 [Aphanomyces euteiches]|nr:hypothetical protein AeRB84_005577 [Aphanomyces euteiches]KAH9161873.1 hypothetical protein LEN26_001211 [Aphanomyces euteiches]
MVTTTKTTTCYFESCNQPVTNDPWRCNFHRGRRLCIAPNCRRQAYARHLCARHGGKRQCCVEGCSYRVRVGELCSKHGVKRKSKPTIPTGRSCGRKRCRIEGCPKFARAQGVCRRHGHSPIKDEIYDEADPQSWMESVMENTGFVETTALDFCVGLTKKEEDPWDPYLLEVLLNL